MMGRGQPGKGWGKVFREGEQLAKTLSEGVWGLREA